MNLCRIDTVEKKLGALEAASSKSEHDTELENKINSMEKAVIGKIREQHVEVEKTLKAHDDVVQSIPKLQDEIKKSTRELKKIVEKKEEKESRELNIIIHNIPESRSQEPADRKKYDTNSFRNIVHALFGEDTSMEVEKVYRLGKKIETTEEGGDTKPRLMLVRLKKKEEVDALLKKRWDLSKVGFSNIYLTQDLTPEEREVQRKLRDELREKGRETHRIFRGRVVPRV